VRHRPSKLSQFFYLFLFLLLTFSLTIAQINYRTEIAIPDIPGYVTLKCDFHSHTVFSDGEVWPTVRVEEAWQQGLDALALTDHIEYQVHQADVVKNHNRPFAIATARAAELGILLIKGAEITRSMPPGHFNALFLQDINPLDTKDWRDAMRAAQAQGAFVFWNHPGWRQPHEIPIWYDEHTELLRQGLFQGLEIVNEYSFYPLALQWALEKKLTILGNSDVHDPIYGTYDQARGQHRPLTLVFATEKSTAAIKDALLAHRTAVYHQNLLIGDASYLRPIFEQAIDILTPSLTIQGTGSGFMQMHNRSDLPIELQFLPISEEISIPDSLSIPGQRTVVVAIRGKSQSLAGKKTLAMPAVVRNFVTAPDQRLPVALTVEINFIPEK
jgi:hypothetical protein